MRSVDCSCFLTVFGSDRATQDADEDFLMQSKPEATPEPVVEAAAAAESTPVEAADEAKPAPEPAMADPVDDFGDDPFGDMDMAMEEGAIAKEALKAEISDGLTGAKPDRAVVGEILLALEAQNPTRSPATSALLNGKWKFLYSSAASPGLKGLMLLLRGAKGAPKSPSGAELVDVQDTFLTIGAEQPRASAEVKVRVLSFENTIKLASRLEAESAVRLVETYDAAESSQGNLRLPFSSPVSYKRSVLISYLDEEMLVVRDALGRPDVLMRVDDLPGSPTAAEDAETTSNDDDAPGAS